MPTAQDDCLFCKIVAREIPASVIDEDDHTLTFLDINPASRGHALVIPKTHARDLYEISSNDLAAVTVTAQRVAKHLKQRLDADGINLINSCEAAAWQTVFHFHMHVIPRYKGDPLRLPWQPKPAELEELGRLAVELAT